MTGTNGFSGAAASVCRRSTTLIAAAERPKVTDNCAIDGRERHIKGTGEQGFHMQGNDLVQRLRDRAYSGLPDPLSEQAADEIARLRLAICRLADQDATLSVQGGHIPVTMDGTLTDAERAAVKAILGDPDLVIGDAREPLCGLLERLA